MRNLSVNIANWWWVCAKRPWPVMSMDETPSRPNFRRLFSYPAVCF